MKPCKACALSTTGASAAWCITTGRRGAQREGWRVMAASSTRVLNWGLLSTARINRALIPVLKATKQHRLLAVGSRSGESAETYAREWNIPRAHASYEALLADPEIDVVYISLPNHMHAEWSVRALRGG